LSLYINKIEVISGGKQMKVGVVGDIPEDDSFVELGSNELLHLEVEPFHLNRLFQLPLANIEQVGAEVIFIAEAGLYTLVEFSDEGHLENPEILFSLQVFLQFLDIGADAIEQADPDRVQLKSFDELYF
jgi:hypothetical protein